MLSISPPMSGAGQGEYYLNLAREDYYLEGGMVGTRQMAKLIELSNQSGAKLVLVGDAKQLQSIEAGGGFKALAEKLGCVELKDIKRQEETWARDAVKSVAYGRAGEALKEYAARGLVTVTDNRREAISSLVSDWSVQGRDNPKENLILAGINSEVRDLNRLAQRERRDAGKLGEKYLAAGSEQIYQNDRVVLTRNSRIYGVRNGQLGTVSEVDKKKDALTVRLDSGSEVKIPLNEYQHLRLGYAVTTHKSQGMTAGNSFVLAGGPMQDRELSYVQVSRAKSNTRLYIDRIEAGDKLTGLARAMTHSRQKELALAVATGPDIKSSIKAPDISGPSNLVLGRGLSQQLIRGH